jgi:hypothetical protein
VGFESTIPEFERANIFLALESKATVISDCIYYVPKDALNCLDYIASNIGMITEYRTARDGEGNGHGLIQGSILTGD